MALAARPPLPVAAVRVGAFAIFHGHAHGAELPGAANPLVFSLGFVLLVTRPAGRIAVRGMGAAISLVGVAFLFGLL